MSLYLLDRWILTEAGKDLSDLRLKDRLWDYLGDRCI